MIDEQPVLIMHILIRRIVWSPINATHHSLVGSVQRELILPIIVQQSFREDVSDQFNLSDLPQQQQHYTEAVLWIEIDNSKSSSLFSLGDETCSTILDNWSTMNARISEIDGQEQAAARLNEIVEELPIVEWRGTNALVLPESHSLVRQYLFIYLFISQQDKLFLFQDIQ